MNFLPLKTPSTAPLRSRLGRILHIDIKPWKTKKVIIISLGGRGWGVAEKISRAESKIRKK